MALYQLSVPGNDQAASPDGALTGAQLQQVLQVSQISTLMALLAGPWIKKTDEMMNKLVDAAISVWAEVRCRSRERP